MAVSDPQLVAWMTHDRPRIRSAALDLLTASYTHDRHVIEALFAGWDRFGADEAFRDFPLVGHLPIPAERVGECLDRAAAMSAGRPIIDRTCRCAGKLIEALSVAPAPIFAPHLDRIEALKRTSKIFFRVPIEAMREKAEALARASTSLELDFEDGDSSEIAIALECLQRRGEAEDRIERGLRELADETGRSPLAIAALELASRHPVVGHEEPLLSLVDRNEAPLADAATVALIRCRNVRVQQLIAERFPTMSRTGQLRCVEIVRRMRLSKGVELLRFLLPHGSDFTVQESIRIAEVLLFDFAHLEDWLEALLLSEDTSLRRIASLLPIAEPLSHEVCPDDWSRIRQLVGTRLGADWSD